MKKFLLFIFLPFLPAMGFSQNTNISGTINKYSKVTAVEYCGDRIIVDTPSLFQAGMQVSTLDLIPFGQFAIFTGVGGDAWEQAAKHAAQCCGIDLRVHVIGPGREVEDYFGDWANIREIDEDGCLLVRPDRHIAWRSHKGANSEQASHLLTDVLTTILGLNKEFASVNIQHPA